MADLRGYGASSAPPSDAGHTVYSKRAMAAGLPGRDARARPRALHRRRPRPGRARRLPAGARSPRGGARADPHRHHADGRDVAAHHGGARDRRLSLAVPGAALPAARDADRQGAGLLPRAHLEELDRTARPLAVLGARRWRTIARCCRSRRACMPYARTTEPAPASTAQLDEADLAAGRKIACPTFVLWGSDYLGRGGANPLEVWRAWCTNVDGAAVEVGPLPGRGEPAGHAGRAPAVPRRPPRRRLNS